MIDLVKAENEFKEYLKDYDLENGSVKLKVTHTYGVVTCSEYIAKNLNLSNEDIDLAKLIGLLHDIGRFEQLKLTKDFYDNTGFDHAVYGVKILFEDGLIRRFIEDTSYDDIIYKAILNHNRLSIEDRLNERELLHAKIIRDADKLDNFRVKETEYIGDNFPGVYNPETIEYETISEKVFEDFLKCQLIRLEDRKLQLDYWVCIIAFIFDLYFDISLKYVKEKNYVDILVDKIDYKNEDAKEKMEKIRNCAKQYIERRVS